MFFYCDVFLLLFILNSAPNAHRICDHLGEIHLDGYSDIDVAPNQLHHLRQMASSLSLTLLTCKTKELDSISDFKISSKNDHCVLRQK